MSWHGVAWHASAPVAHTRVPRTIFCSLPNPHAPADAGIRTAVVLATSQKTLPIAIAVLAQLSGAIGPAAGFAVVACVLAHLTQTVFDSLLVSFWNARKAGKAA